MKQNLNQTFYLKGNSLTTLSGKRGERVYFNNATSTYIVNLLMKEGRGSKILSTKFMKGPKSYQMHIEYNIIQYWMFLYLIIKLILFLFANF